MSAHRAKSVFDNFNLPRPPGGRRRSALRGNMSARFGRGPARLVVATSMIIVLAGCASAADPALEAGEASVVVKDCQGKDISVPRAPRRVVTLDGYAAQAMARLGLADRIVGTGYPAPFQADTEPHRSRLQRISVLSPKVAVTELVASARPDLVLTGFSAFGVTPGGPKDADLRAIKAPGLAACLPRGGPVTDLSPTYDFLLRLGRVFGIEDRAQRLVAGLRARERAVAEAAAGHRPRVLVLQDDPVGGQPLKTSGTATIAHALISKAGGANLFPEVTAMHADVSLEQVLERDPEVIWIISDYPAAKVKGAELTRRVAANRLLGSTTAVRRGRVGATSQYLVSFPTPLNLDALEQLAGYLKAARS
jgi:iron complex transport system substrate-binding protein